MVDKLTDIINLTDITYLTLGDQPLSNNLNKLTYMTNLTFGIYFNKPLFDFLNIKVEIY